MIEVNLLPESQRKGARRKAKGPGRARRLPRVPLGKDPWTTALLVAAVLVPILILAMWLVQRAEARGLEERLVRATAESTRLADLRAISDSLTGRQRLIRERVALVQRLDGNRFVWPRMMDEISRALPQFAWLTNLRQVAPLPDVAVQIQGMAANPLTITEFVRNLQASPFIADVRIVGSQQQEVEEGLAVQAFTLVATYRRPGAEVRTEPIVSPEG